MAVYGLTPGFSTNRKKLAVVVVAVTGTGAIATGLSSIDAAFAESQNSATTIPSNSVLGVTSLSGGTANVAVNAAAAGANAISAVSDSVAVLAIGA